MNKPIKIGVMGCANIAKRSVIPAILNNNNFELIAVASRSKEKANEFATLFNTKAIVGYNNLLKENIDAIYMPLPTGLHEEWVLKCIDSKKHIFVEKSFATNYTIAKKLLAKAKKNKCVIKENFMFPYHSQNKFLTQLIKDKAIGEIRSFNSSFCFPPLKESNFRYDKELGGGALLDAGAYPIKATQLVFGDNIKYLSSTLNINKKGVDITGSAHLLAQDKIPIHLTWGFDNFYQCQIEILGTAGKLSTNRSFTAGIGFSPSIFIETNTETKTIQLPSDNHFDNILNAFHKEIIDGEYIKSSNEIEFQSYLLTEIQTKSVINEVF